MLPQIVLDKLETLPVQPGCYLFKDKKGAVVYVGKAKSLRSRVRSYFQVSTGDERYFIPLLQRIVGDLETLVTGSEKEAAILEDALIKQHQPRFNVKLRDDKSYLCLRIDTSHTWPRVEPVRRPSPDGTRYFGPYHSATAARRTLHLVNKHFLLRTCSDAELAMRKRPCLQYQIRRCLAPCVYEVDKPWYQDQVRAVGLFLDGRHDELSSELQERMRSAARNLEFELAASYRDQLRAVDAIRQEQRVVAVKDVDQDVVGMYREGDLVHLAVLFIRSGRVNDTGHYPVRGVELPDDEVLAAFVSQFYGDGGSAATIPDEVVLPVRFEGADGVAEWLSERRGRKVELLAPQRGPRADLVRLATENAEHAFREQRRARDDVDERLAQVQKRLRLPTLPRRIECCDISHIGGNDTVGAIVALKDGQPDKSRYRTFHVRTVAQGDDYGAMYEVLARRFRRGRAAQEARSGKPESEAEAEGTRDRIDWDLPDLFVVDGGRGQLNVALAAARDLGLHELPIVGLAKEKSMPGYPARGAPERNGDDGDGRQHAEQDDAYGMCARLPPAASSGSEGEPALETADAGQPQVAANGVGASDALAPASAQITPDKPKKRGGRVSEPKQRNDLVDRVYLPGQKNGIPLQPNSAPLFFLARARDEAHRFSNRARERLGKARKFRSQLDDIPGIGPVTRRALLRALGSLDGVRRASDGAILAVPGVSRKTLQAIRVHFPLPPTITDSGIDPSTASTASAGCETPPAAPSPCSAPSEAPSPLSPPSARSEAPPAPLSPTPAPSSPLLPPDAALPTE